MSMQQSAAGVPRSSIILSRIRGPHVETAAFALDHDVAHSALGEDEVLLIKLLVENQSAESGHHPFCVAHSGRTPIHIIPESVFTFVPGTLVHMDRNPLFTVVPP